MRINVIPFSRNELSSFFGVHSRENCADWCYCSAWWVPTWDGWGERVAEANLEVRLGLIARGIYDGYLLYVDDAPAAWAQVVQRDQLAKLVAQYRLEPRADTWAITCLLTTPSHRRQRLAFHLVSGIIEDLRMKGVARLEAYPKRGEQLDELGLWTGPEELYVGLGFRETRAHPTRPVLALDLHA